MEDDGAELLRALDAWLADDAPAAVAGVHTVLARLHARTGRSVSLCLVAGDFYLNRRLVPVDAWTTAPARRLAEQLGALGVGVLDVAPGALPGDIQALRGHLTPGLALPLRLGAVELAVGPAAPVEPALAVALLGDLLVGLAAVERGDGGPLRRGVTALVGQPSSIVAPVAALAGALSVAWPARPAAAAARRVALTVLAGRLVDAGRDALVVLAGAAALADGPAGVPLETPGFGPSAARVAHALADLASLRAGALPDAPAAAAHLLWVVEARLGAAGAAPSPELVALLDAAWGERTPGDPVALTDGRVGVVLAAHPAPPVLAMHPTGGAPEVVPAGGRTRIAGPAPPRPDPFRAFAQRTLGAQEQAAPAPFALSDWAAGALAPTLEVLDEE